MKLLRRLFNFTRQGPNLEKALNVFDLQSLFSDVLPFVHENFNRVKDAFWKEQEGSYDALFSSPWTCGPEGRTRFHNHAKIARQVFENAMGWWSNEVIDLKQIMTGS